MKAKKTPSGNYRVQLVDGYDSNGKRIVKSFTANTECEALQKAIEYKQNRDKEKETNTNLTVRDALDEYIEVKTNVLSPASLKAYRTIRNSRLLLIKDIPITQLKTIDIQRAVNQDAIKLSRKSIKEGLALLKSACSMQDVEINIKKITLPPAQKKKQYIPTVDQILPLIIGTEIELPCLLAMWLSLRISEVRGLQFKDISEDGSTIYIRRTKIRLNNSDVVRENTKTVDSTRTNRLPPYLFKLIQQVPHNSPDDFIVPLYYEKIRRQFKAITSANGYNITFHTLRHEFATTLNDLGIPSEYIQKLGGWSTDNVMKSVYTHTIKTREQEYQDIINEYFNNKINKITKNNRP